MPILQVKPLSVNDAWTGKRFKTRAYRKYAVDVSKVLPRLTIPKGPIGLVLAFGLSNMGGDTDNPVKPFIDCLQSKYRFNDNRVSLIVACKTSVPRGKEFIKFEIFSANDTHPIYKFFQLDGKQLTNLNEKDFNRDQ